MAPIVDMIGVATEPLIDDASIPDDISKYSSIEFKFLFYIEDNDEAFYRIRLCLISVSDLCPIITCASPRRRKLRAYCQKFDSRMTQ